MPRVLQDGIGVGAALYACIALPGLCAGANADVRLSLADVVADPGERVAVPLSLSGEGAPGIISLNIHIAYRADWLTFVEASQGELVADGGFIALANVVPGEAEDQVVISLAGTQPLSGEGQLLDLVFQLGAGARSGQQSLLRFASETRANRGLPVLLTDSGWVAVEYLPPPGDFNGDRAVDYEDFYGFAERFGSRRGERRFEAACDLDEDGLLDLDDFYRFAELFGMRQ